MFEDLVCKKCGKCCYYKFYIMTDKGPKKAFSTKHCKCLDPETKLCTIYNERFYKNPECLSVEEAIEKETLPNDCPYVKSIFGYDGPEDLLNVFKEEKDV